MAKVAKAVKKLPKLTKAAMKVVEVLRMEVRRPAGRGWTQDFMEDGPRRSHGGERVCPMGLHKNSTASAPSESVEFDDGKCSDREVMAFATWWDRLEVEQVEAAIDLIWPRKDAAARKVAV